MADNPLSAHPQAFLAEPLSVRAHVLVIDDDERIRDLVSRYLGEHGFIAVTAASAAEARSLMKSFAFDIMVVDVMMPEETGTVFVSTLRRSSTLPVLLLTALGESRDRIAGLESGADDYLAKPFEPRELVLRLHSILRRTATPQKNDARNIRIGTRIFDPRGESLQDDDGTRIRLTGGEANLLRALTSRLLETVSREDLARLCGLDSGERTIDVQVTRLRRKIEDDPKAPRYLMTVRGRGYVLKAEEVPEA